MALKYMKKYFKNLKQDRLIRWLFIISLLLLIITLVTIIISYSKLPPLIPLYNQLPWGESRLSSTIGIFIPLIFSLSILIINFILSAVSYSLSPLISRVFSITTFLISLITFLFTIRTILLIS